MAVQISHRVEKDVDLFPQRIILRTSYLKNYFDIDPSNQKLVLNWYQIGNVNLIIKKNKIDMMYQENELICARLE